MKIMLQFEPSEIASAADLLEQIGKAGSLATGVSEGPGATSAPQTSLPAVIRLYERMPENESARFMEALTAEPLLFEEIGKRMAASDGKARSAASVRAIYRNIRRREKTMLASGVLSGYVVRVEWAGYEQERAGRYYLDDSDLQALNAYLDR